MRDTLTNPTHETAGEPVLPTVGLCRERGPKSTGQEIMFGPGESVHVRAWDTSVVVQSIGGTLPPFAAPHPALDERQDVELVILHEAPWLADRERLPERLWAFRPMGRAIIADQVFDQQLAQEDALPWADVVIHAAAENLDVVAEVLASILTGELLLAVDWKDLCGIAGGPRAGGPRAGGPRAGGRRGPPGRGRAVVVNGVGDDRLAAALREELSRLEGEGFDGGWFLTQLTTSQDYPLLTLERLDQFATKFREGEGERDFLFTAALNASCRAVVAIAFRTVLHRKAWGGPSKKSLTRNYPRLEQQRFQALRVARIVPKMVAPGVSRAVSM